VKTQHENLQESFKRAQQAIVGKNKKIVSFADIFTDEIITSKPELGVWDEKDAGRSWASIILMNEARFYELRSGNASASIYCKY